MLLYLAGLKGVDPRCGRPRSTGPTGQDVLSVVFPVMRPINIIVLVVTVIEALRAFDIVWVINKGTNGLELIGRWSSPMSSARPAGSASAPPWPPSCW